MLFTAKMFGYNNMAAAMEIYFDEIFSYWLFLWFLAFYFFPNLPSPALGLCLGLGFEFGFLFLVVLFSEYYQSILFVCITFLFTPLHI